MERGEFLDVLRRKRVMRETSAGAYWMAEDPLVLNADNLRLEFYEMAGVLQIGFLVTDETGRRRVGRRISLRKDRILPKALFLLRDVFARWAEECETKPDDC
jgi:hypothetical protein